MSVIIVSGHPDWSVSSWEYQNLLKVAAGHLGDHDGRLLFLSGTALRFDRLDLDEAQRIATALMEASREIKASYAESGYADDLDRDFAKLDELEPLLAAVLSADWAPVEAPSEPSSPIGPGSEMEAVAGARRRKVGYDRPSYASVLAHVSINGRMAFALVCIERTLEHLGVPEDAALSELVEVLWSFTSTLDVADWEFNALNRTGQLFDVLEGRPLDEEDPFPRLPDLPEPIGWMISHVVELGRSNLYSATVGISEVTLEEALVVADLAFQAGVVVPDPEPFLRSPFTEHHGWGRRRWRSFFVENFEEPARPRPADGTLGA